MAVIMVMMVSLSSHINDGRRHRQHRRILILNKLSNTLDDEVKNRANQIITKICIFYSPIFAKRAPQNVRPLCVIYKLLVVSFLRNNHHSRCLICS